MNNYVEIDIETSGLDECVDEIIRLSALKIANGAVEDKFVAFCKPNKPLRKEVELLTGITNGDLNDKPTINEVLSDFLRFIGDEIIGARNADFILRFINIALEKANMPPIKNEIIDTYSLAKESIIKNLIKDKSYADFLCGENIGDTDVIKLICRAPISLFEKRNLLQKFETEVRGNVIKKYISIAENAIRDLESPTNGLFLLSGYRLACGQVERIDCKPFASYQGVCKYLRLTLEDTCDGQYNVWYHLERYALREKGYFEPLAYVLESEFIFIGCEPCFYKNWRYFFSESTSEKNNEKERLERDFEIDSVESARDDIFLNLPTPFRVGDILHIDCRPFAPKISVTVVENSRNYACEYPQCEYVGKNGESLHGSLKKSRIYNDEAEFTVSPLYNLTWQKR